jgi:hypothetical protein
MTELLEDSEQFRQYLLGELSPEELWKVEENILANKKYFDQVMMAEDELVDSYLSGEFSAEERKRFELNFLVTEERRKKLRFASALKRYVSSVPSKALPVSAQPIEPVMMRLPTSRRLLNNGWLPLLIVSIVALSWLAVRQSQLVNSLDRERERNTALEQEVKRLNDRQGGSGNSTRATQSSPRVLSLALSGGLTRSGGNVPKSSIPANIDTVKLKMEMPSNEFARLRAVVVNSEGAVVFTDEIVAIEGSIAIAEVPADLLAPDDYRVTLSGAKDGAFEDLKKFQFQITAR